MKQNSWWILGLSVFMTGPTMAQQPAATAPSSSAQQPGETSAPANTSTAKAPGASPSAHPSTAPQTTPPQPGAQQAKPANVSTQPTPPAQPPQPVNAAPPAPKPRPSGPVFITQPRWPGMQSPMWRQRFQQARKAMERGDFRTACESYAFISTHAPAGMDRVFASNQYRLCSTWVRRHMVLVPQETLQEQQGNRRSRTSNQRTTDELVSLYGSALYYGVETGFWIGTATDAHGATGYVLPMFLTMGAGATAIAVADSNDALHYGVPQSIATGTFLGFEEGLLWTAWNQSKVERQNEWEPSTVFGIMWGMSTAGALAGGIVGESYGTTPGRAAFVGSSATWTAAFLGMGTAALSDEDSATTDDHALLMSAIGLNAGALGGALGAGAVSPTTARVRFIDLGGITGLIFGLGSYAMMTDSGEGSVNGLFISTTLGSGAGIALAAYLTRNMPRDEGHVERSPDPLSTALRTSQFSFQPTDHGATFSISGAL